MDRHGLNGACLYINDFKDWFSNANVSNDIRIFINDRFSECSKQQKDELYNIFSKLADRISSLENHNIDTYEIVNDLVNFFNQ